MPVEGFFLGLREICDQHGMALIFDEVITGFRLGLGGAQQYFNISPDLSIFAKAIGSGYPISVVAGKKKWMHLIEEAKVIHAGTMNSGNPTVAAALATIDVLEKENPYPRMFQYGKKLMEGLREAAARYGHNLVVQGPGPMFHIAFTNKAEIKDYRDTLDLDRIKLGKFVAGMHDRGIRVIGRGLWYISVVHTAEEIDHAVNTAAEVFSNI